MPFSQFSNWLRQHGASSVAAPLLLAGCVAAHIVARAAVNKVDPSLVLPPKAAMRIAIVDYIDTHPWIVFGYLVFALASLLRLELRNAPRWSTWSVLMVLALPCIAYAYGCLRVWVQS
jgi:hypothetical protein